MFLGEFKVAFSGRGRLVLPRKFRDQLVRKNQVVLSRGLDGCIWGFDLKGWEKEAEKQLTTSITEKEARDLRRYLFSAAEIVTLDVQGRFVIPSALLRYANLEGEKEAVFIGAGDHFEIWTIIDWEKLVRQFEKGVGSEK